MVQKQNKDCAQACQGFSPNAGPGNLEETVVRKLLEEPFFVPNPEEQKVVDRLSDAVLTDEDRRRLAEFFPGKEPRSATGLGTTSTGHEESALELASRLSRNKKKNEKLTKRANEYLKRSNAFFNTPDLQTPGEAEALVDLFRRWITAIPEVWGETRALAKELDIKEN
jgi:hypothetical protein